MSCLRIELHKSLDNFATKEITKMDVDAKRFREIHSISKNRLSRESPRRLLGRTSYASNLSLAAACVFSRVFFRVCYLHRQRSIVAHEPVESSGSNREVHTCPNRGAGSQHRRTPTPIALHGSLATVPRLEPSVGTKRRLRRVLYS